MLQDEAGERDIADATGGGGPIQRITDEGLREVEQHLRSLGALDDAGNAAMLRRLRDGCDTLWDIAFYDHERLEANLMRRGLDAREAHLETLRRQGIRYEPGYEARLFHPDVIRENSEWFPPAAHPR